jgi:type VI secretion system protein ImpJ
MTIQSAADRIQWHEGMLLSPQHFQTESARVDQLVAWQVGLTQANAWGVSELVIDEQLLANGVLRIVKLVAIMPDGFAVEHSVEASPEADLSLDLLSLEALDDAGELAVYVVLGRSRVLRSQAVPARFVGKQHEPVEDEVSQATPIDIPRSRALLSLHTGDLPSSAYVAIKLLMVKKDNDMFTLGSYEPPWLSMPSHSKQRKKAEDLASQSRSKAVFLAKQMAKPSSAIEDRVLQLEVRARLSSLLHGLPALESTLKCQHLPPYQLYLSLCAHLGSLITLRPGAVPPMLPPWNHADPAASLKPLFEAIDSLIAEVSQDWREEMFAFNGETFELHMNADWLGDHIVLGISGQTEAELVSWMSGAVIGSRSVWSSLSDYRVLGAARKQVMEVPEMGLRGNTGRLLFSVQVDSQIILKEEPLVIGNVNMSRKIARPQQVTMYVKG